MDSGTPTPNANAAASSSAPVPTTSAPQATSPAIAAPAPTSASTTQPTQQATMSKPGTPSPILKTAPLADSPVALISATGPAPGASTSATGTGPSTGVIPDVVRRDDQSPAPAATPPSNSTPLRPSTDGSQPSYTGAGPTSPADVGLHYAPTPAPIYTGNPRHPQLDRGMTSSPEPHRAMTLPSPSGIEEHPRYPPRDRRLSGGQGQGPPHPQRGVSFVQEHEAAERDWRRGEGPSSIRGSHRSAGHSTEYFPTQGGHIAVSPGGPIGGPATFTASARLPGSDRPFANVSIPNPLKDVQLPQLAFTAPDPNEVLQRKRPILAGALRSMSGNATPTRRSSYGLGWKFMDEMGEKEEVGTDGTRTVRSSGVPLPTERGSFAKRVAPTLMLAHKEHAKCKWTASSTAFYMNVAIGLQIILGALTTGISAATSGKASSLATATFGGVLTLLASYLARVRGSGEPERSKARAKEFGNLIRDIDSAIIDRGWMVNKRKNGEPANEHEKDDIDAEIENFRLRFENLMLNNESAERKPQPA